MKTPFTLRRAGLILCAGLVLACGPVRAQQADASAPAAPPDRAPLKGEVALDPRLLVQLVASRSAEIQYSRMQIEVAGELSAAEAALYEAVLFGTLRQENRERQRTVEERLASLATSRVSVLDERVETAETGVRSRLPTGAEVSLAYRLVGRRNNIISSASRADTEYNGALVLTLKQPLLRGSGKGIVETDLKLAQAEHQVALLQYRQQLLKTSSDALAVYWQLYRALEVQRIRQQALDYARRINDQTRSRIDAGKLPASNMIEADAAVLLREAEQIRSEQGVREAESRLQTLLNISGLEDRSLRLVVRDAAPNHARLLARPAEERYRAALETWPALAIARLRTEQANLRLRFAADQRLPAFDLVASRSNTGLANDNKDARGITESGRYPEWYVGVNLEIPIEGNQKARSQYLAQATRVKQAELELASIHNALANDIRMRWEQAAAAQEEVTRMSRDVELRTEMLRIEKVRYEAGMGLLMHLLQRETELTDSRQRLVESNARLGQANDALLFADGSLLQEYGITLRD